MTLIAITIIAAVAIYSTYNAFCLALFGIPESLSMTFYLWQKKIGNGYLFVLMMSWVVGMMMPAWITMSEGSDFQFLAFLAPASLMFVATAPHFLSAKALLAGIQGKHLPCIRASNALNFYCKEVRGINSVYILCL